MTAHAASTAEAELPPLTSGPHRRRIGLISVVACLGGLLFGYDTGVANGAEGPMAKELGLSLLQLGVVISSLLFAAAIGALLGGIISDAIGRRKTILILALLFFVGVLLVVFSPAGPEPGTFSPLGFGVLVSGRIVLGLAVGGASTVVPVFLAELSPYEIRGSITGRNELAIVVGQLSAFVVNAILGVTLGHVDGVWRLMFAVCALPAVALFFGMLRMPESPRWLVEKGKYDEALTGAEDRAFRGPGHGGVRSGGADRPRGTGEPPDRDPRDHGQQVAAAHHLRRHRCVHDPAAHRHQLDHVLRHPGAGGIRHGRGAGRARQHRVRSRRRIGGIIALRNMDRIDRRKTFMIGLTLTTTCHCLVGIASMLLPAGNPARPYVILVLVVAFVLSMQTFLNIAVWVWLAEVFPLHMRGLGIGMAVFFCWVTNGFLGLYFPTLVASIGITGSFFLFAGIGVVALLFVYTQVPETRGRSLEALEEDVSSGQIYVGLR